MWGFLGKLFGSDKAIEKGIDTISNGLDKLIYTKEEQVEDFAKDVSEARRMVVDWMRSTQGQNLARRLLALLISGVWLFMYLLSSALDLSVIWVTEAATITNLKASATAIGARATEMNGAMMLILGFYFAAPHMSSIVNVALEKFGGKKSPSV